MLRKNGKIFSCLFLIGILSSWFYGVLVDCSNDEPKRIHRRKDLDKNYDRNLQKESIPSEESLRSSNGELRFSRQDKKMVSKNFRVQESIPSIPPSFTNGISKEIHVKNFKRRKAVKSGTNRNIIGKPYKSASKDLLQSIPRFYPSSSNSVSKEVILGEEKERLESMPQRNHISESSNTISSKRFHLSKSSPSFLPSFSNDISKQQISNIPSLAPKVSTYAKRTSSCRHKRILRNVRLKHGRRFATFELRGRVRSVAKCVEKCCERRWCNIAYRVDGYCYSVHCPTDKACEAVDVKDPRILSDYVLLNRPQNMNYKRNFIPGAMIAQGEKKLTVTLNITNEKFRAPLADLESLDFLNVAERVENAISGLLKAAVGFKSCEITSFRPTPLIANVTLKLSKGSPANETGSLLLKALRDGKMDSTLEDAKEHFKLSQVGFEMKSWKGESLVCHSEINYQNSWSLTMYGAFDQQPCPRNAQGECSRRCLGSEKETVRWDVPNFSDCTSLEFRDLHEKAKELKNQAEAKLPLDKIEAKAGIKHVEILKKLQKITYHHTFRDSELDDSSNKTNNTYSRLHDFHTLKIHQLKTNKKPKLIHKDKSQAKPKPTPPGLLSLTNQLLNIKDQSKERYSVSNGEKSRKNHPLSIADKIGLLQPNASSLPSSDPARPGGYHVLNQNNQGQHEAYPTQHVPDSVRHEARPDHNATYPAQHVSPSNQHISPAIQHVPSPVHHVSNPLQRDPHPVVEKGQNRNDISVSVSVSGEFGQPVTNETDLSGVFLKSGPENIRSHVPKPNLRSGLIPITNPPAQRQFYQRNSIARPNGYYIPRPDIRGNDPVRSKPIRPKPSSNTLLNWLNGALQHNPSPPKKKSYPQQKAYQNDVSSSSSNSLHPQLSQRYNVRFLGNTRSKMGHLGILPNTESSYPVQKSLNTRTQGRRSSSLGHALFKRSLVYNSFQNLPKDGIRPRLSKRQTDAWNRDQNYYTTSAYNNDRRQDNPSSEYPAYDYHSNVDQRQDGQSYPSTNVGKTTDDSGNKRTSSNSITDNPINSKNAYFTGINDNDDSPSEEAKNIDSNALPVPSPPPPSVSSDSSLLAAPSPPDSNAFPAPAPASSSPASSLNLFEAPPPPSRPASYEDNPPRRPLSPPPSSSFQRPPPHPPPISPPTFNDYNPPHRPLSPPPLPKVHPTVKDQPPSPPVSSYSPLPPSRPSAPPPPSSSSPSSPSYLNPPPPPTSPLSPPSYYPAPNPPPPSYTPPPPITYPTTSPSYNPAPASSSYSQPPSPSPPSYYPTPPSIERVTSPPPSSPTQPNSNSSYDSLSSSLSPTYQSKSSGYNSSSYPKQSSISSTTYDPNPSSSESSYYTSSPTASAPPTSSPTASAPPTSSPTYQESSPPYNSSSYTQPNPNSTYNSYSPTLSPKVTYQRNDPQYNSSAYPTPQSDTSYLNSPNQEQTNFSSTNETNNKEYTNNNNGFQTQEYANDIDVKNIGDPLNNLTSDSLNLTNDMLSDYNMTTQPVHSNSSDSSSEYNNIYDPDYNVTFQKIADNVATDSPESTITDSSTKTSDISAQNNLYKDLGDSQTVVGFTKPSSTQPNQSQSSNDIQELGSIVKGISSPRLTIEDMKKRIKEFSSGYENEQTTAKKKTLVEQNKVSEDSLAKGKHLAPMFGGDLLLAADTVKHLAKFNDYIRPPIVKDDVKEFLKACSNILDAKNSREWKNAQRHVVKLNKIGLNIMSDSNAVDWERASKKTVAGSQGSSSTLYEMVEAIESFGLSASYQMKEPITEPIITGNIVMELKTIQSDIQEPAPDIVFPNISDPRIRKWTNQTNVISLSPAALDEVAQGANVDAHVCGVLFKTVGDLSIPIEEGQGNESIESGNLMSMSVYPKITGDLDPPIRIVLAHLNPEMSQFKQDCVFLNASASGVEMWSNKGCKVADVNETHTTCECNHMSSFTSLVDKSKPNDFILKTSPMSSGEGGAGSDRSSSSGILYIALLFLLILAVIIIIIFVVWKKRKGKSKDEQDRKTAKSGKGDDENETGGAGSTTEAGRGKSSRASSSGDKKKRRKEEGRKEGRKKKSKKPHTLDKDAITEEDQQGNESKPEDTKAARKRQQQREREEQQLMKEKAMIFSDYRQPYNFLAHEESAPVPLDSSTPLPSTSKADSYPRRQKRPTSFVEPPLGQPGFNLRKHHSESNFPMQALHPKWGLDSPRDKPQRQGSVLQGSIREEPLEEERLAEDIKGSGTPRGTSTPSETASVASQKSKKKFWKRKSKENLNLEAVQEGERVTTPQESPKKKKKLFGKKNRSASRTSLNASQENLGAPSGDPQTPSDPKILTSKPPISPAKKKKIWQRKKPSSQASLESPTPRPTYSIGKMDEGQSGDDGLEETSKKRGSMLRRLSKSGSRTSLSASRSSLSKSEESLQGEQASIEGSPKKRRSSILGKLSRSGSKSSLSKSQSSLEGLDSAEDEARKSPKRKQSLLGRLSKSRSSLSKSEDSLDGDTGVADDGSKASRSTGEDGKRSRKTSVLRKLSKSSKTGSRRSSKSQDTPSILVTPESDTQSIVQPGGAEDKLSQSGSTLSLSKGGAHGEGSIPRKKKGLFGKKKSSSKTSLHKGEDGN